MEQQDLEQRVREIFERQGFSVESQGNVLTASNGKEFVLKAFSSSEYSISDVEESVEKGEKVFVDLALADVKNRIENDVSILYEKDEKEHETPSYELIGDIAVINDLSDIDRDDAVEGILAHQNVKTILLKEGGLKGEYRVGDYERLYGEETETIHKEFGCRFRVDPTKVYFSERFSTERKRVVDQIEDGEKVLVMFAGVGPFAVLAARLANPEKVIAVEKNPVAASYMKENIKLNSVEDTVEGIEGDVNDIVPDLGAFDRVIMPLPESAQDFLPLALEHIDHGTINYYRFLKSENWSLLEEEVSEAARATDSDFRVSDRVICGERGPDIYRVCLDIEKR